MPFQSEIFGFVHHTHSSTAQLSEDAVVRDGLANQVEEELLPKAAMLARRSSKLNFPVGVDETTLQMASLMHFVEVLGLGTGVESAKILRSICDPLTWTTAAFHVLWLPAVLCKSLRLRFGADSIPISHPIYPVESLQLLYFTNVQKRPLIPPRQNHPEDLAHSFPLLFIGSLGVDLEGRSNVGVPQ
jgi:hypothetical protein